MTGHPEAVLARELGLCYTSLTLVTDLDAGAETGEGVSHDEVLKVFAANVDRLRERALRRGGGTAGERDAGLPVHDDALGWDGSRGFELP